MDWLKPFRRAPVEVRGVTTGSRVQSASDFFDFITGGIYRSASDVVVTTEAALGVPAIWSASNFLSGTLAGLPLKLYRKNRDGGRDALTGGLADLLHYAPNPETSSFEWRKLFFDCIFTTGRGLSYIERSASGTPVGIWHMEPERVTIEKRNGRKFYIYNGTSGSVTYAAADVIDVPFMLKADGLSHRSPIGQMRDAIGLAISATAYGSKFLANGGVPPFAITGNFQSLGSMNRAATDFEEVVRKSSKEARQAVVLPTGLDIKPIGGDPEKSQLIELNRFCIEQVARIYSLPPVFLQDLTHGTFSNTEQQDLHFVKHTVKRWVEHFEQEVNLKLFGARANSRYVEMSVDGLLRGDFKTRFEGYATAVQHGIYQPAEVRTMENLPFVGGSDKLFLQGAMVPIDAAGPQAFAQTPAPAAPQAQEDDADED
jgi:HK97 family phage portal protein